MALIPTPVFTQTPSVPCVQVSVSNSNYDGTTGTYSTAITFGANGALVDYVKIAATGTPGAAQVNIFYADDGSTYRYWDSIVYSSPGAHTVAYWFPSGNIAWNVAANSKIKFSVTAGDAWNVFVHQGAY